MHADSTNWTATARGDLRIQAPHVGTLCPGHRVRAHDDESGERGDVLFPFKKRSAGAVGNATDPAGPDLTMHIWSQ